MRDPKPDPTRGPMDVVTRLSQRVAKLCPAEQKVAQTVLSDITEAAAGNIQMPAKRAGVNEASVTHFVKTMGCRDVHELKLKLVQTTAAGRRFLDGGVDRPPSSVDGILADISSMLEANHALVQPGVLHAAATTLVTACMIAASGMGGGSITMADEVHYRLARLERPVITYHGSMLQWTIAVTLSPDDAVIMLSMTGRVPEVIDSVTIARGYGARIVATTAIGSPLAALADVLLPTQTMEADFTLKLSSSRYVMMMMIGLLVTGVALQQIDRSRELLWYIKHVFDTHRGDNNCQLLGN